MRKLYKIILLVLGFVFLAFFFCYGFDPMGFITMTNHLFSRHRLGSTIPETNIAPENRPKPKRKGSSSNHPFSGANLQLFSGSIYFSFFPTTLSKSNQVILCDLFIPKRWRSPTTFEFRSRFHSPSQKGHQQNCRAHDT